MLCRQRKSLYGNIGAAINTSTYGTTGNHTAPDPDPAINTNTTSISPAVNTNTTAATPPAINTNTNTPSPATNNTNTDTNTDNTLGSPYPVSWISTSQCSSHRHENKLRRHLEFTNIILRSLNFLQDHFNWKFVFYVFTHRDRYVVRPLPRCDMSGLFFLAATSFVFYINVVNSNTEWEVFFNGVSQKTYFSTSSGFANCTYQSSNSIQSQKAIAPNITVLVHGSDSLSTSDSWSFEVNNMM